MILIIALDAVLNEANVLESVFSPNIAWYLFLAGAGSGAYALASVFYFTKNLSQSTNAYEYQNIAQGGFYLGPLIVLIGVLFLIFDLGTPQKAFLLLIAPRPTLLTVGTWFIVGFCLTASATLFIRSNSGFNAPRFLDTLCAVLSLFFALGIMVYTGLLFCSMSSLPLLHAPAIVVLLTVSSLSTGSAVITLYGFLNQRRKSILFSMRIIPKLDISLLVLEVLTLLAVFLRTGLGANDAQQITAQLSIDSLFVGEWALLFWPGVIGAGLLLPIAISIYARHSIQPAMLAISALSLLAGGLALRFCLIMAAQYIDPALYLSP